MAPTTKNIEFECCDTTNLWFSSFSKFCLQYSVEVTKVYPLFAVLVVNDVVVEGISWVHTLLYSSFYFAIPHFPTHDVHNAVVDERGGKKSQPAGFIYGFTDFFWPGLAMGNLATSEFIPHSLKWWHTPGFVVGGVCLLWGGKLPCAVVWSDLSSPSVTYH